MKSPFKKVIGIDPGKGGGIAIITEKNEIEIHPCPQRIKDMSMLIGISLNDVAAYRTQVFIEKVWAFPTDGRVGSFTFGQNYGQWEGILHSHELEPKYITPKVWQSHFEIKKGLPKDVRKRQLKELAKKKFSKTKGITLKTADAILIAVYGNEAVLGTKYDR